MSCLQTQQVCLCPRSLDFASSLLTLPQVFRLCPKSLYFAPGLWTLPHVFRLCPKSLDFAPEDPALPKNILLCFRRPCFCPQHIARFWGVPSKMVFGHNLHLMAPFEILEAGFCTEFWRAYFCFYAPGLILEPLIQFLDLQVNILARGPFWANFGVPENILLLWN